MLATHTWGYAFFNFGVFPDWAGAATAVSNTTAVPMVCYPLNGTSPLINGNMF